MEFEEHLKQTFQRLSGQQKTSAGIPENLSETIQYSLLAPGKRIRPRLSLAVGELLGLEPRASRGAAVAVEMIHCFTLIHDDLPSMDDDDFRRGRPSSHRKFGEALALLAGDGLIPLAQEALLEISGIPSPRILNAVKRLVREAGPRGVVGGQAAELKLSENSTIGDLGQVFCGKTGSLFRAAILIPADLAGVHCEETRFKSLEAFANSLAHAFQIGDDLEDLRENPNFSPDPSHILYYNDAKEVSQQGLLRLQGTMDHLEDCFGKDSIKNLKDLSHTVSQRLK